MHKIKVNSLYDEICTNAHIRLMNREELLKNNSIKAMSYYETEKKYNRSS